MKLVGRKRPGLDEDIRYAPGEHRTVVHILCAVEKGDRRDGRGNALKPGVTLCDGIAYEYAQDHKIILPEHDFEQDILACAQNIGKRYMGSRKRGRRWRRSR